jgi:hypothetical protein
VSRGAALLALALARPAAAQSISAEVPVVGGVRAGVAMSSWIGTGEASPHLGLALGGFVALRLTPRLALQPELLLHDRGADFTDPSGAAADEALLYAEPLALVRVDRPLGELVALVAVAGPGLALLVDSKRTPRDELRAFDVTLHAGVGLELYTPSRWFTVDLRGGLGARDLLEDDRRRARAWSLELLGGVTL